MYKILNKHRLAPRKIGVRTRGLLISLSVSVTAAISSCGALVTMQARAPNYDAPGAQQIPVEQPGSYNQLVAEKFTTMAIFAEAAYRRNLQKSGHIGSECSPASSAEFTPPYLSDNSFQWVRLPTQLDDVQSCVSKNGLYFETHVLKDTNSGDYQEAVISFRGTELRQGQWIYDLSASFAALFGFEPNQYRIARQFLPGLIEYLRRNNKNIKIYAVGHSLGGGLAQQAGYLSRHIAEVVTFNSSPVTNWSFLRHRKLVDNEYPIIYRIYHGGEILENVRYFTTAFTKARFGRYDIGLQYGNRSSIGGHSMTRMTCALAGTLNDEQDVNVILTHGLQIAYLREEILKAGGLCDLESS